MQSPTTLIQTLDTQFSYYLQKILSHPTLTSQSSKHIKIRINSWLCRLQSILSNHIWKKNRNNYIKLLYIMLQFNHIIQPFILMPQQQILTLHKHQINCILQHLNNKIKQKYRDKQNKPHFQLNNVTPYQLWNNLQNKFFKNQKYSDKRQNISTPTDRKLVHAKIYSQTSQQPFNHMQLFSPISHTQPIQPYSHINLPSNSSPQNCIQTLTTLTTLPTCNNKQLSEQINKLKDHHYNIIKPTIPEQKKKDSVKYFKNNRQNTCILEFSQIQSKIKFNNYQHLFEFYQKIFIFLKKYQKDLEKDKQYCQILKQLQFTLKPPPSHKPTSLLPSSSYPSSTIKSNILSQTISPTLSPPYPSPPYPSSSHPQQHPYQTDPQITINRSYDYISSQFSQYSFISTQTSIQPPQPNPPQSSPLLLLLPQQTQKQIKKTTLDTICQNASKALLSIKQKINIRQPQNFCFKTGDNV